MRHRSMTRDELVEALRLGRRSGDCVPEDIESVASAIINSRVYHVFVRDEKGNVFDPMSYPETPKTTECTCDPEDVGPTGHGAECPVFKTRSLGSAMGLLDEAYAAFQQSGQPERDWPVVCELIAKNSPTLEMRQIRRRAADAFEELHVSQPGFSTMTVQEQWEAARPKGCRCPFGVLLGDCPEHGHLVPE